MVFTKPWAQERFQVVLFSKGIAQAVVDALDALPVAYWYHRLKINSIPTGGDPTCSYHFLGHNQMPKVLREALWDLAPAIPGAVLREVCCNWYAPGEGMPEHRDLASYQHNVVVALNDNGDGVIINDDFFPDIPGLATVFPRLSEPHMVPAVKHKRYVLIFLYD